jgi:DNA gyrase subunit A
MPVIQTSIEKESRDRYLTYALSVVSSRALPDVRDGLKPVQRRILYDMYKFLHLNPEGAYRKSAAVVGGVLARFHPHGDTACYEAMVRMAQDFSMRYPLVDGQGNFGSIDGDSPAAYRYTEAKLRALAIELMGEIDEETVSFRDNFDGTQVEPVVLPSRIPNLLINGAMGIAVGMATSIPPHNLRDTTRALLDLIDDPEISIEKLVTSIKGPDFPTGCLVLNTRKELNEMYRTGRGQIRMRGEWVAEEGNRGKQFIIIKSIPYALDKSQLVEKIANLIVDRKVPQLVDVRDESTDDVRVVLELAPGASAEAAMAYLYKNTPLESNFAVNMTALVPQKGILTCKPELLNIKQMLEHFLTFRLEVTEKRLQFEKKKLLERIHILEGFVIVYDALDEVIKIIRKSDGRQDSAEKLRKRFSLSELQSFAIVDMRLHQLSKTSIDEIRGELREKEKRVGEIDKILKSPATMKKLVRDEISAIGEKFGDKRRCEIIKDEEDITIEIDESAYIVKEDVFALITQDGWLKRIRQNNEISGTRLREGDALYRTHALNTADSLVLMTSLGNIYSMPVSEIPASSGYGSPIQKILKFKDGERIVESFGVLAQGSNPPQGELFGKGGALLKDGELLITVSAQGMASALKISELGNLKKSGKRIMKLREGDEMVGVVHAGGLFAMLTKVGHGLVVESKEIPERDGAAVGVIAMGLKTGDRVVAALEVKKNQTLLLTLESGGDKEVPLSELTAGHRGLQGKRVIARGEIKSAKVM